MQSRWLALILNPLAWASQKQIFLIPNSVSASEVRWKQWRMQAYQKQRVQQLVCTLELLPWTLQTLLSKRRAHHPPTLDLLWQQLFVPIAWLRCRTQGFHGFVCFWSCLVFLLDMIWLFKTRHAHISWLNDLICQYDVNMLKVGNLRLALLDLLKLAYYLKRSGIVGMDGVIARKQVYSR